MSSDPAHTHQGQQSVYPLLRKQAGYKTATVLAEPKLQKFSCHTGGVHIRQLMIIAYDWIAYHAKVAPNSLAQIDVDSGRESTYAKVHDRVGRLAAYLRYSCGIDRGDRVAVLALNC